MPPSIVDFSLSEGKIVKVSGMEVFKQNSKEKHRASVIAFKRFHDVVVAAKEREAGQPLSDEEKLEIYKKIDSKLAESLGKSVEQLTDIDRLDIQQPRFSMAYTHYDERVGTIRCLSTYEEGELVKAGKCCLEFGDASQTIATVIMLYPVDEHLMADMDLLKGKKYTYVRIYRMSAKKFKQLESTYKGAISEGKQVIDLKISLDGDPKYQNQKIEDGGTAVWAREDTDPEIREWALSQGLRGYKHVSNNLGFEMTEQKLIERLSGGSGPALKGGDVASAKPQLAASYSDLLK
jgi:hypothetical protein